MVYFRLCFFALFLAGQTSAIFEDQAFKFDWKRQFVGAAQDAVLHSASKTRDTLILRTESNVLAALDGDSGRIQWRQVLGAQEILLDLSLDGKSVTSLSFDASENSTFVRIWNAQSGALTSERRILTQIPDQEISEGFIFDGTPHLVHRTEHNGLKIHAVYDNDEKILHSFSTGAGQDKFGFSCTNLADSYVCVSAQLASVYSTKLPLSGNSMTMASLSALGITEPPKDGLPLKRLNDNQVQISLFSGSLAILTFKNGKFEAFNTIKAQKANTVLHVASCPNDKDLIILEQSCDDFVNCEKLSTIRKGQNQHTFEDSISRGLFQKSWAFCDSEDKDAYQLIVRSQDGSLTSLTPLGNVMWQREEALASIKAVKLVSNHLSDDDGTYETENSEISNEHVLEMFLKRLKHHGSQIHMLLEKIKLGKVGLGTLLLGNPDSNYDDFGLRKVIVAFSNHGTLHGLDSKSGQLMWQKLTNCANSNEDFLFLQRGGEHHGLVPVLTLICEGQINRYNPYNGDLLDSRKLSSKVNRAIQLHQTNEDHIRPILLFTDDNGLEIEPKDAAKSLKAVSGKMYVANIDSDQMGIHGYRLMVNSDGTFEKVPVWSFSSSGAKIIHLKAKPAEEIVHSQGRVMADRSVLFKYLNPNLAFVVAEGQDANNKAFINLYLLDLVTGRNIFSANHKRVQGPYHAVHSENWIVYTYYNEKARRAELGSLELFEGKTHTVGYKGIFHLLFGQRNATVFSSLHKTTLPLVERQSYILGPSYVTSLKDTITEKGITTKNLLMATSSGSIYNIPRHFLDPRRSSINTPPEMREPGLPPYVPELVFPPEVILNYNQTLTRVQGITTATTGLESTSVVFVHGLDLYCSRVNPSKGFDLLKDDFEHYVIASVLVALTAAAYITRKLSQRKMLMSAWK